MTEESTIVPRVWSYFHVLRDDGVSWIGLDIDVKGTIYEGFVESLETALEEFRDIYEELGEKQAENGSELLRRFAAEITSLPELKMSTTIAKAKKTIYIFLETRTLELCISWWYYADKYC